MARSRHRRHHPRRWPIPPHVRRIQLGAETRACSSSMRKTDARSTSSKGCGRRWRALAINANGDPARFAELRVACRSRHGRWLCRAACGCACGNALGDCRNAPSDTVRLQAYRVTRRFVPRRSRRPPRSKRRRASRQCHRHRAVRRRSCIPSSGCGRSSWLTISTRRCVRRHAQGAALDRQARHGARACST